MFVYLGSVIVKFDVYFSEGCTRDIIGWNNYITAEETLQQAGALAHSKIKFDLDNIRENIGDIEMNVFVRIQCESGQDVAWVEKTMNISSSISILTISVALV